MENIRRSSLRFNLDKEKSREAWECLHCIDMFGYESMQDFILDAVIAFFDWKKNGTAPYKRIEIEEEFKRWMREVLEGRVCVTSEPQEALTAETTSQDVVEEVEIENSIFDLANDFLSAL